MSEQSAHLSIPDFSLVILIGPTGSGKSTFARKHFLDTEIISSDHCRALVSDDETNQDATADAFDLVHYTASLRLKRRLLTVIDATSVRREDRAHLIKLARQFHALPVALVLNIDPGLCHERNQSRPGRKFGPHVAQNQSRQLRKDLRRLQKDGFRSVQVMRSPEEVEALTIERTPLWTDLRKEKGPFDIIGDIHGCFEETCTLLETLGYRLDPVADDVETLISARHPEGRTVLFVGDITDRGPRNVDSLRLVMGMCREGTGKCVVGNHDYKLNKWLKGRKVTAKHGLQETIDELEATSDKFRKMVGDFLYDLRSHFWLADGRLVVAHAGLKEEMHGRGSSEIRNFAMFGDTTGERDEYGLPVRLNWGRDYKGAADVVYGHTPVLNAEWLNNTICIDTGCVFGGKLTALRWPELETVSVPARETYYEPVKPLDAGTGKSAQQDNDRLLYFDDYALKQRIETRFGGTIVIPEENSLAALEITSRFGIDPRWLIYLPPTMAAPPTAPSGQYLEHPDQAIDYFAKRGVSKLIAQEKHMGSRALLVVAKNSETALERFGVEDGKSGIIYTRTGRPFFADDVTEAQIVSRFASAMSETGLWERLQTDWVLLDAEVMPWSAKARTLLERQYRPTHQAAQLSAEALLSAIASAPAIDGLDALAKTAETQRDNAQKMAKAIDGYCWDAETVDEYQIAPFHILAVEGRLFADQSHAWHMETLGQLAKADPFIKSTCWRQIDTDHGAERDALLQWWLDHTAAGGEGLVLKPLEFLTKGEKCYIQPAMKVRGKEYLRIIYGPDYDMSGNMDRLRDRNIARKSSLALREFKLGLEGLRRFVERQPLAKVHACALGVLALESEPVDPRL
ncbi:MAG: polynucleotide kinase-phosphatase [Stappiaceae bacterium]